MAWEPLGNKRFKNRPLAHFISDAPISALLIASPLVLIVGLILYYSRPIPHLPSSEAAALISQAPEFKRIGRLVRVDNVFHYKDSGFEGSRAQFEFTLFNSDRKTPLIKGNAGFAYWDRSWHLKEFSYGCDHIRFRREAPRPRMPERQPPQSSVPLNRRREGHPASTI
jgi:hypothetical protein